MSMELPEGLMPVLALIESQRSLGKFTHYEVVYYDEDISHKWQSYGGSKTFENAEKVIGWKYCIDIIDQ